MSFNSDEIFENLENNSNEWENKFIALKKAADILHENINTNNPKDMVFAQIWYMLSGYAVEARLKKKIIHEKPGKNYRGHDLVKLCEKANVKIDESEELLLEKLTNSITWVAKYPVPLNKEEFQKQCVPNKKTRKSQSGYSTVHFTEINKFLKKIQ